MKSSRRDVKSRNNNVFHKLSRGLIKIGLMPNHISIASSLFGIMAGYGFFLLSIGHFWGGVINIFCGIQLRLVCNLIDGLMAVEGKLSSPQGELYNDVPDRISDWFIIFGVGFPLAGANFPFAWHLCWMAAVLAILTAYIRVLGASQGVGHDFGGPMAKQHRMAVLNLGLIGTIIEKFFFNGSFYSLYVAVLLVALGSFATCILRLKRIARALGEEK